MARYSHSRLTSYKNCPKKFLWQYVWDVRPPVEGVEAFLGKRLHEALEGLYLHVVRAGVPPPLAAVLRSFHQTWDQHWSADVRIVRERTADEYRDVGHACLERYYRRHQPFRSGATVGLERAFEFPVAAGTPHVIRGYLDRVDIADDGTVEVHDYKSGQRVPSPQALAEDLQVRLYEVAARHLYPEHRRVRMVWHYLQSGVQRSVPEQEPAAMGALRRSTGQRIDEIEARIEGYRSALGPDERRALPGPRAEPVTSVPAAARAGSALFPARVGPLCRWCGLLSWCEEGSRYAGMEFRPPAPPADPPPAPRPPRLEPGGQARLF